MNMLSESELIDEPSTSYWLKEQLAVTKQRDPVDALHDAEQLVAILQRRLYSLVDGVNRDRNIT